MKTTKKKPNVIEDYLAKCLSDVEEITGVRDCEILTKRRGFEYVSDARFLVYLTMRSHELEPSYQQIGTLMGRNHAAVIHGIKAVSNKASYCKKMNAKLKALRIRGYKV